MNTAKHLLSCEVCGDSFELPATCHPCSKRTDTPVCPPFHSDVISMRTIPIAPPPTIPAAEESVRELLTHQKRGFRRVVRRLDGLTDHLQGQRHAFTRGLVFGVGGTLTVMKLLSYLL